MSLKTNVLEAEKYTYSERVRDINAGWVSMGVWQHVELGNLFKGLPHRVYGNQTVGFRIMMPEWIHRVLMLRNQQERWLLPGSQCADINALLRRLNDDEELRNAIMAMIRLGANWTEVVDAIEFA